MATSTVTAPGQATFRKEFPRHLGMRPGAKVTVDLLPDGRAELRAEKREGPWSDLAGFLEGRTNGARLSIGDIDEAIAEAGAAACLGKP